MNIEHFFRVWDIRDQDQTPTQILCLVSPHPDSQMVIFMLYLHTVEGTARKFSGSLVKEP